MSPSLNSVGIRRAGGGVGEGGTARHVECRWRLLLNVVVETVVVYKEKERDSIKLSGRGEAEKENARRRGGGGNA